MKEIPSLSNLISNEANINNIYRVSNQLHNFCKKMAGGSIYKDECKQLYINIQKVLVFWAGGFYVGVKKEINMRLYPKICVNPKRSLGEIYKLRVHFDVFRSHS